ncbi:pyridoxal-phosphate dependent enzyme [Vibrio lentus]|nr:pyridoxal-phosphate dependent enzyme [Vibrio lentus]
MIAASAGNHAQGMALSGSKLGIQTTIVMPKTTPDIKVDAVRGFGGKWFCTAVISMKQESGSGRLSAEHGFTFVPPFDHPLVITGQI